MIASEGKNHPEKRYADRKICSKNATNVNGEVNFTYLSRVADQQTIRLKNRN